MENRGRNITSAYGRIEMAYGMEGEYHFLTHIFYIFIA